MTELEVLYKLERAYSRKWWQLWKKYYRLSYTASLCVTMLLWGIPNDLHNRVIKILESVAIKEKGDFEYKEDGFWWPINLKEPRLQTIRSAIAKLTEKGNL